VSAVPPGENGTMILTGRAGQSCANEFAATETSNSASHLIVVIFSIMGAP
jgi:hypothetical protein